MSAEGNKAIVRGYMEQILNQGNLAVIDNYFNKEGVYFNSQRIEPIQLATFWRRAFPDVNLTLEDQIGEGDKVVTRVILRGTHQGEYYGIAATGKQVTWTGIAIDRIIGGKVVEMWHEADELGILQQLGVHFATRGPMWPKAAQPPLTQTVRRADPLYINSENRRVKLP